MIEPTLMANNNKDADVETNEQDLSLELVGVNVPIAEDVEHDALSLIYEGVGLEQFFRDLKPSDFWFSENIYFFVAAHSLYLQIGRIDKDELCRQMRLERKVVDAKYAAIGDVFPRPESLISILREKEFRRSVMTECMSIIYLANSENCGHNQLVERCKAFQGKVLSGAAEIENTH